MTRDITKEEQEAIKAIAWKDGYARAMDICQAEKDEREINAVQRGIRIGRNEILKEVDGVQWGKLSRIVLTWGIVASVIGCGIILALAVGLTNIPNA
jgi:hypothetical protein